MVRFRSILFISVIWLAVLLSGCVGDKNVTEPVNTTPVITATAIATATPLITPLAEVTPTGTEIQVKLNGARGFIPNIQTINAGDEIVWDNYDPITVTLVSNDGLFENKLLAYYQQYRYVFLKPGTFTFSIKNKNLTGTIIVEYPPIQRPAPSVTTPQELPFNALFVTARMETLSNWSTGNEIKYGLDAFKVNVINQVSIPFTIKAQILSGDQVLEERTFTLENQDSQVEFTNEKKYFINDTNVTLRLLIQGYPPIEYRFIEAGQLN
jgi:plastocyanin